MRTRSRGISAALVALLSVSLVTLATPANALPDDGQVDALLHKRLDSPRIGSDFGMVVIDGATGAVVSAHDPDKLQLPASNMKIITAVTALSTLGVDKKFVTRVRAGTAPNEVILEGGGDPLLSTTDLQELARVTASQLDPNIRAVVRVDDDYFPKTKKRAPGWTTGYIPSVVSRVSALARLWDYSSDPSRNAADVFAKVLRDKGLKAKVGPDADAAPDSTILGEVQSNSGDAVRLMLSISENNVAEVLYRQVALATGHEGTWKGGRVAAEQALAALGINSERMKLLDGSGLSRDDRLSATFLASVLRVARVTNPEPFRLMFERDAMPLAGETRTLAARYGRFATKQSKCARGEVYAKTGSLFDTIALAGVAETTTGGERMFAFLVNDRPLRYSGLATRQALDGLAATVVGCWT